MPASFQPLSALEPDDLIEYLGREGHSPAIVRWKYFDQGFARGRERGYAWVKDGKIGGFIGLIPCRVKLATRTAEAAWTCDWSVQDPSGRGMGILLIRQAQLSSEYLLQLGGNEASNKIVSRMAALTVNDAGIVFHLLLRAGALLRTARRRYPGLPADAIGFLNRVPLRRPRKPSRVLRFAPGVWPELVATLEHSPPPTPVYDLEYLRWQIERCPELVCESCGGAQDGTNSAGALLWREKKAKEFWRMALWVRPGSAGAARELIRGTARHVYEQGGFALSMVVSRLDTELIQTLKDLHFVAAGRRRPLHILTAKKNDPDVQELRGLSFVDTDYAYRFS